MAPTCNKPVGKIGNYCDDCIKPYTVSVVKRTTNNHETAEALEGIIHALSPKLQRTKCKQRAYAMIGMLAIEGFEIVRKVKS